MRIQNILVAPELPSEGGCVGGSSKTTHMNATPPA